MAVPSYPSANVGGCRAQAWLLAEREAKGLVAVDRLLTMRAFGRI